MRKSFVNALPLLAALAFAAPAQAQQREITGKVLQQGSNAPAQEAQVGIVGQPIGARTNDHGEYRLRVPAGDVTISVRAIGFKRQARVVTAGQSTADFMLERDVLELEGVTVTGAATTIEKKNAATAVAAVSAAELTRAPSVSIENALQGKVIGASINMNNGAPGGGGQIQIRGASSLIGNTQPLFIVDGVAISNAVRSNGLGTVTGSLNSGEENGTNRLADLNPNDIESIEILKSAAASAIYGSRATNGVVVITTKRGSSGAPRLNVTQRVGTYQAERLLGSRHFDDLNQVLDVVGGSAATAAATAACNPKCPYFDYQKELYGQTDPSYESVASVSGGVNNTRYYASGFFRQEAGVAEHLGAKRQSLRASIDQSLGDRITFTAQTNVLRSFSQRGISNNDNALSSPIYAFAYAPAIIDLQKKDASGRYPLNPFPSGVLNTSNPFQTFDLLKNDEDVYRMIFSGRANYNALTWSHNTVNFSLIGGADRFSNENYIIAPQELQFQRAGTVQGTTFPGEIIQGNGTNLLSNVNLTGTWNNTKFSWLSATTSGGLQYESRQTNDYNIRGRGLGPQQKDAAGAANIQVTNARDLVLTQAFFGQEEFLAFGEKLYLSGAVRGERASVNGDRNQLYYFPRFSGSYRFVSPFRGVNELKIRANYGESGNQAGYGERDLVIASYGLIDGRQAYGLPTTFGNPTVKPERLAEKEYGADVSLLNERVRLEGTYYDRNITDLLVRPQLAPSTGVTSTTINGGEMNTKGYEFGATVMPVQTRSLTWTSRATWFQNKQIITSFPVGVQPFTTGTAAGGFGNAYGRLRYAPGHSVSTIWGNKVINGATVGNTPLGDANPRYLMSFGNDVTYKALSLNVLVDYRRGGLVSNMTKNLFDEGGNTWDYDNKSPDTNVGATLGAYRYNSWNGGRDTGVYLEDGSYTKVREVNLSLDLPRKWYTKVPGAKSGRLSVAGRNLFIISPYNGFDPEVNNGGNFVVRFVDLAPFPPTRSFFFSVDFGF